MNKFVNAHKIKRLTMKLIMNKMKDAIKLITSYHINHKDKC